MIRMHSLSALFFLFVCATVAPAQPGEDRNAEDERDTSFKHWQWQFELTLPKKMDEPFVALPLTTDILRKARLDHFGKDDFGQLSDLRLADAKGTRIPFHVRSMSIKNERRPVSIKRHFNAAPSPKSRIYETSYELADIQPPGHNEIEIHTTGRGNYRRKVEVFGDDNDQFTKPKSILGKGKYLVYYEVDGKVVDVHRFRYDFMQYRFLQVRVHADDITVDEEIPQITSIVVRQVIEFPGEFETIQVRADFSEATRGEAGPATAWWIPLTDGRHFEKDPDQKPIDKTRLEKVPIEKLRFEVFGEPSERPMRLEIADPNQPRVPIYGVEWRWVRDEKAGEGAKRFFLEARFNEVFASRLRLVVTDFANERLNLSGNVEATRSVRKLYFEKFDEGKYLLPLRLYVGNPTITPPGYEDLRNKLKTIVRPPAALANVGGVIPNPTYEAPPTPLHERMPWLVYVILGAGSVVLLLILAVLVKQAITRHDQKVTPATA